LARNVRRQNAVVGDTARLAVSAKRTVPRAVATNDGQREPEEITMLKNACIGAAGALAVAVLVAAPAPPAAAASCKAGYEPVRIQGNWVCRVKTPKLPIKANTQGKKSGDTPFKLPGIEGDHMRERR
jgi:hypothetical protein